MILRFGSMGEVECEISVERETCDSYISSAYSLTLDRELTDAECVQLDEAFRETIEEYAADNGARWS